MSNPRPYDIECVHLCRKIIVGHFNEVISLQPTETLELLSTAEGSPTPSNGIPSNIWYLTDGSCDPPQVGPFPP